MYNICMYNIIFMRKRNKNEIEKNQVKSCHFSNILQSYIYKYLYIFIFKRFDYITLDCS